MKATRQIEQELLQQRKLIDGIADPHKRLSLYEAFRRQLAKMYKSDSSPWQRLSKSVPDEHKNALIISSFIAGAVLSGVFLVAALGASFGILGAIGVGLAFGVGMRQAGILALSKKSDLRQECGSVRQAFKLYRMIGQVDKASDATYKIVRRNARDGYLRASFESAKVESGLSAGLQRAGLTAPQASPSQRP